MILLWTSTQKYVSNNLIQSVLQNASFLSMSAQKCVLLLLDPQQSVFLKLKSNQEMYLMSSDPPQLILHQSKFLNQSSVWSDLPHPPIFLPKLKSPHLFPKDPTSPVLNPQSSLLILFPTNSDSASSMLAEKILLSNLAKPISSGTMWSLPQSFLTTTTSILTKFMSLSVEDKTNSKSKVLVLPTASELLLIMSDLSESELPPTLSSTDNSKPLMLDTHGDSSITSLDGKESESKLDGVKSTINTGALKLLNLMEITITKLPKDGHSTPNTS